MYTRTANSVERWGFQLVELDGTEWQNRCIGEHKLYYTRLRIMDNE